MCTFPNNPKTKRPTEAKSIAYKVFGRNSKDAVPRSIGDDKFKLGRNVWDKIQGKDSEQSGFQVFAKKKDAVEYVNGFPGYFICSITIYTKDIVKATSHFDYATSKVYEVSSFAIWKKDWKNRKTT